MSKQAPPSYEQSQGMANPQYNPTYPNAGQIGFQIPSSAPPQPGAPYPTGGDPYPGVGTPYPNVYQGAGQHPPVGVQPYPMQVHVAPMYATGPGNFQGSVPVVLAAAIELGPLPTSVFCPTCKETVTSKTKTEPGVLAWVSCGTLLMLGCWFGCCLLPFCIEACHDVYHSCPRCKTYFGRYTRCK